jgi:hypothetical protein
LHLSFVDLIIDLSIVGLHLEFQLGVTASQQSLAENTGGRTSFHFFMPNGVEMTRNNVSTRSMIATKAYKTEQRQVPRRAIILALPRTIDSGCTCILQ